MKKTMIAAMTIFDHIPIPNQMMNSGANVIMGMPYSAMMAGCPGAGGATGTSDQVLPRNCSTHDTR